LLACAVPVLVGAALAQAQGSFKLWPVLAALVCAGLLQIGTNLYNDYADFKKGADTADRLGPARATQKGWLTPKQVSWGAAACFAAAVLLGSSLVWVGGWPILLVGVLSVLCGYAYTGGPLPLAYHGLGELFVLLFFGLVAVAGTYYVQALSLHPSLWWAAVPVGALASAILVVNNLRDRLTDARANKRTLAVRLGATATRVEYSALLALSYASPLLAALLGVAPWGWMLSWITLPLALREARAIWTLDGAALNPHLGGTARLEMAFGLTLAVGVVL
jgi:1,4-dihydroxy-2-naphthoate octaprenyltransferase